MLKAQPIEGLGVVDCSYHCCRPGVFEVEADLIPHVNQQVVDAASLDSAILVLFACNLCAQPVKHKALVHLGGKHRA